MSHIFFLFNNVYFTALFFVSKIIAYFVKIDTLKKSLNVFNFKKKFITTILITTAYVYTTYFETSIVFHFRWLHTVVSCWNQELLLSIKYYSLNYVLLLLDLRCVAWNKRYCATRADNITRYLVKAILKSCMRIFKINFRSITLT